MAVTEMKKKAELIFLPFTGIGHLASALELAQLLISRDNQISITILCFKFPTTPFAGSYIRSVLASQSRIKLVDLPEIEPPPQDLRLKSIEHYISTFMESLRPHVKATVQKILSSYATSDSSPVVGLVLDFMCLSMVDVAEELGIPSYLYLTSSAVFLGYMLSLHKRQVEDVFDDSSPDLLIPGISNLVPSSVLPTASFNRDGGYATFYKLAKRFRDTKGIIVNTFSELEHYAIDALSDGKSPPIYPVGPLIGLNGQHQDDNALDQTQHDRIIKWLDEQPPSSVVFLCFGSRGNFSPSQTREIALALQHSGARFLWAMRSPPTPTKVSDEEKTLPEGFLEWMEGRGMLCDWAPQVKILAHKAIGGFVSHCGWNSCLESLWFGVPILTWPIYAEQQLNAFTMVKEFGLAVELKLDYRRGGNVVMAGEIEKGLKQLMDRDNVVHKKVQEMKEMARKAVDRGGSSFISVGKLIEDMIGYN